ncbi:MAG: rhomboid family intramembrane serine protease [Sphingomonadaceae bacterium]|nr:rhomboid family intramembrane serine protease [Sphingomonadaceae bacterium]
MRPFQPPKPARATNAIIMLCVAVQLLATLAGHNMLVELAVRAGLMPARLTGVVDLGVTAVPAPLTLVTSLFVHGGWLHLILNLLFLLIVGRMVEWVIGPARLVGLFVVGGVAGGLLQTLMSPESTLPVIGASGAIAAVFACYATLFAKSRANARTFLGVTISSEVLTALWFAAVWIILQLMTGAAFNAGGGGIAIWAHIGGFVAGLLIARPLARRPRSNVDLR